MWSSHGVRHPGLAFWLTALALVSGMGRLGAETPADLARRAGLHVYESRHLTLVTDRPPQVDGGIETLPSVFDQAFVT
jgi:hypothetical protein